MSDEDSAAILEALAHAVVLMSVSFFLGWQLCRLFYGVEL